MSEGPAPASGARGFSSSAVFLLLPLLLSLPRVCVPHDLWLVPGRFQLDVGESTRVFINNGDVFPEALSLLAEPRVAGLWILRAGERTPVEGRRVDGRSLTFDFEGTAAGIYALALETRPRRVRLKAEDFNDYLKEEALSQAIEQREELGETEQAAVERYTKWAKAYISVGTEVEEDASWSEPVGQRFEIVPISNPTRVEPGKELSFKVLYDDEPIEGVAVIGGKAGSAERKIRAVTDSDGVAAVSVSSPGRWYLRAIHMIHLEADDDAEWESFWCTLTFEALARTPEAQGPETGEAVRE